MIGLGRCRTGPENPHLAPLPEGEEVGPGTDSITADYRLSGPESLPVFIGRNKRLNHLGLDVVAVELVQLG